MIIRGGGRAILSPSFFPQVSSSDLRMIVDDSQMSDWDYCKYYMYMFAPPISDFELRSLSDGDSYTVEFLEKSIPLRFSFLGDGRYLFTGISEEEGLYFEITLDPVSMTYDYLQVMLIEHSSGMKQIISIGGDDISLYDGKNSKGKINVVARNDYNSPDQENYISIGECEFYTSEILEAALQYTFGDYRGDDVVSLFDKPFTIEAGKELYNHYFTTDPGLEPTHDGDVFYIHDKVENRYDINPSGKPEDDPLTCLADTLDYAKKLDPDWIPEFK